MTSTQLNNLNQEIKQLEHSNEQMRSAELFTDRFIKQHYAPLLDILDKSDTSLSHSFNLIFVKDLPNLPFLTDVFSGPGHSYEKIDNSFILMSKLDYRSIGEKTTSEIYVRSQFSLSGQHQHLGTEVSKRQKPLFIKAGVQLDDFTNLIHRSNYSTSRDNLKAALVFLKEETEKYVTETHNISPIEQQLKAAQNKRDRLDSLNRELVQRKITFKL